MASESIVIRVDLETGEIEKQLDGLEKSVKKTGESIDSSLGKDSNKKVSDLNETLSNFNKQVANSNKELAKTTEVVSRLDQNIGSSANIGKLITGVSILAGGVALVAANADILRDTLINLGVTFGPLLKGLESLSFLYAQFSDLSVLEVINKLATESNSIFFELFKILNPFEGAIDKAGKTLGAFGLAMAALKLQGADLVSTFKSIKDNTVSLIGIFKGVGQTFLGSIKNLFGLTTALASVATGLALFATAFDKSNNEVLRIASNFAALGAVILGGLSAALSFAIIKVGQLITAVGTSLVGAFQNATSQFLEADRNLKVFVATIGNFNRITDGALGLTDDWLMLLDNLSTEFGLSTISLQKAASEIINVGTQLGLNTGQLKELIRVSSEYAVINGKDVFDTSVALVGALNGQSQAVVSLGLKLNENSNQLFTLKKGYEETFTQLAESEKVQVRYNNLLSQFSNVAGIAAVTAGTLSAQNEKLNNNIERINIKLGAGARLIEDFQLAQLAANKVLAVFSDGALATTGFIGALGARILQLGGFILEWSFKIFALIKAYQLLNVVLSADITQSAFARGIPFVNSSLTGLLSNLARTPVQIRSATDALKTLGLIAQAQGGQIFKLIFGISTKAAAANGVFRTFATVISSRIVPALKILGTFLARSLVVLAPLALKIGALILVFNVLKDAFVFLEQRTKVFSRTFALLAQPFRDLTAEGSVFSTLLKGVSDILVNTFSRAVGVAVFAIGKLFEGITFLAQKNPFGVFSKSTVAQLSDVNLSLKVLNEQLLVSGFNIDDFANRSVAASGKASDAIKVNLEDLRSLQDELKNVGKSDLQILQELTDKRLTLLNNARNAELISEQQFNELKTLALLDFELKRKEILARSKQDILELEQTFFDVFGIQFGLAVESAGQQAQRFAQTGKQVGQQVQQAFGQIAARGIQRLTQTLISGKNAFQNFGKFILGSLGELATQMGTVMLTAGIGMLALKGLNAGSAIAAGAGLIALGTVLNAISGGEGENAAAVGAAPGGAGGQFAPEPVVDVTEQEQLPQNQLFLTVQGDVLDSDQTGLRIVSIIRDFTDKNGETEVFAT